MSIGKGPPFTDIQCESTPGGDRGIPPLAVGVDYTVGVLSGRRTPPTSGTHRRRLIPLQSALP